MIEFFPSRTVAVTVGNLSLRWYGLFYLIAFFSGWWVLRHLLAQKKIPLSSETSLELLLASMVGVTIGGRLGYAVFYEPAYFLAHPLQLLAVWQGGMSFHGGLLGVALAVYVVCRLRQLTFWQICDLLTIPVALGLALGRLGNFINGELYGPVTTLPWGVVMPGVEGIRHPTQLYAVGKNLVIALICWLHLRAAGSSARPGQTTAIFLVAYSLLRFLIEYVRVQEYPWINVGIVSLTRGQVLTLPLIVVGLYLWFRASRAPS